MASEAYDIICFELQQEEFRSKMPVFLTRIGEVLQTVNREILLILKANDLLRGIEFSLNIDKRYITFTDINHLGRSRTFLVRFQAGIVYDNDQVLHRQYFRGAKETLP